MVNISVREYYEKRANMIPAAMGMALATEYKNVYCCNSLLILSQLQINHDGRHKCTGTDALDYANNSAAQCNQYQYTLILCKNMYFTNVVLTHLRGMRFIIMLNLELTFMTRKMDHIK